MNLALSASERTLIVSPMHCKAYDSITHPSDVLRMRYPIAYSHLRGAIDRKELSKGDILLSDTREGKVICWIIIHGQSARRFDMDSIESCIDKMVEAGLPEDYDIAFPALGFYEEDGVDMYDVADLVSRRLESGRKLDLHLYY